MLRISLRATERQSAPRLKFFSVLHGHSPVEQDQSLHSWRNPLRRQSHESIVFHFDFMREIIHA